MADAVIEYDIEYRTQKAIKSSVLAYYLTHQPVDDYQSVKYDYLDKDVMYLKVKDCDELCLGKVLILNPGGVWCLMEL